MTAVPDRRRIQVPPAWKIARYWFRQREFEVDPGQPACFACRWRDDRAPVYPSVSVADAWTRSKLERAHLVPHVLGGSDNDVSNYVMLCQPCHKAAPDWLDPRVMLRWVRGQKHYLAVRAEEAIAAWATLWPDRPLTAALIKGADRTALSTLLQQKAGTHAHRLKPTTVIAALGELTADVADDSEWTGANHIEAGTTDAGDLSALLLDLFAEMERRFTPEWFARIRATTAAEGRRLSRRKAHSDEQIKYARLLRAQGDSLAQIVDKTGIPKSSVRRYLKDPR